MSTITDTVLPDGTIQRVVTYDPTTTIYTQAQYQRMITDAQGSMGSYSTLSANMSPVLSQAKAALKSLPPQAQVLAVGV